MMFFDSPRDVTAVVLTTGEPTTQRAIDSVRRQTMPVREVVVREIRPFHKALNAGARQVATPFFVQVDADMVLDPNCVATLRKAMKANVGISVGRLRDEILQQVVGIKMFRTACFEIAEFRDSISPDTDFVDEIERAGWQTVYVGKRARLTQNAWSTLGEHSPDYAPAYTYRKYLMEGRRYHHRSSVGGLRFHLGQLEQSRHPSAFVAQIALARGFFRELHCDALGREDGNEEFGRLQQFLSAASTSGGSGDVNVGSDQMSLPDRFHTYFRTGRTAFEAKDPEAFRHYMAGLNAKPEDLTGWISKLALCQGLLATSASDEAIRADFMVLSDFLSSTHGFARVQSRTEPVDPAAKSGLKLDDVMSYAADAGLRRFVMTPPTGARHGLSIDLPTSQNSAASVVATVDAKGRPRIEVPFRMFGHVVFTEPERTTGLFWCYDLLKAGYLFAHIPTALGARRALVPALIARNVLERLGWRWEAKQRITALFRMAKPRKPTFEPDTGVVLMVTDSLGRGGSERQMVALSYGLLRRGYQVQVLSLTRLNRRSKLRRRPFPLGITPTYAADSPPDRLTSMSATLSSLIRDYAALPKPVADRIPPLPPPSNEAGPRSCTRGSMARALPGALAACITGAPEASYSRGACRSRVGAPVRPIPSTRLSRVGS